MSVVTLPGVSLGSTYLIQVGMWDATSAMSLGILNVTLVGGGCGGQSGSNDTCAGAIAITGIGFLTYDNSTISGTSGAGSGFDVPTELPFSPAGQIIAPGDVYFFQVWYRDEVNMPGDSANFSNMIEVIY